LSDEPTLADLLAEVRATRCTMERLERKIATLAAAAREPAPIDDEPTEEELLEAERFARRAGMVVRDRR